MPERREFKAKARFAAAASLGYGLCIAVSLGFMAGRTWFTVWPFNLITETLLLVVATLAILQSYLRVWIGPEQIVLRLPNGRRSIQWDDLAVYEICRDDGGIVKLRSFDGTRIHLRFAAFDHGQELAKLVDGYATKPV